MQKYVGYNARNGRPPVETCEVLIVGGRVVKFQTRHIGESVWIASAVVSEQVPTGPRLARPIELSATGVTEEDAIQTLRQRVMELNLS
jgi:hypothetical protein